MSNVLYKQAEQSYLYQNRGAVGQAGTGADRVEWYLLNRPDWTNEQIAFQLFNGSATIPDTSNPIRTVIMKNPRLTALEMRVAEARLKAKPPAKPRGKPVRKAVNGKK